MDGSDMPDAPQPAPKGEKQSSPQAPEAVEETGVERHAILSEIFALMESVMPASSPTATPGEEAEKQPSPSVTGEAVLEKALKDADALIAERRFDFGTWEKQPSRPAEASATSAPACAIEAAPVTMESPVQPSPSTASSLEREATQISQASFATPASAPAAAAPAPAASGLVAPAPMPASTPQIAIQATSELAKGLPSREGPDLKLVAKIIWEIFYALLHVVLLPVRIPLRLLIVLVRDWQYVHRFLAENSRQFIAVLGLLVGLAWLLIGLTTPSVAPFVLAVIFFCPPILFALGLLK